MAIRGGQELPYLGHMPAYPGDSLHQFVLGALEFLAPVSQLDWVKCIHPAWIERLEARLIVAHAASWSASNVFTLATCCMVIRLIS
jgi:hypothetical protein